MFNNNLVDHNHYGVKGAGRRRASPRSRCSSPAIGSCATRSIGGRASLYPPLNFFPPTFDAVGFVDLAGGDYRLAPDSPLAGQGQGGTDVGADIDALEAAINGP